MIAKPQLRGAEGHEADAESRRRDPGPVDGVRRGGAGRLREHPAVVVQLPAGRRQRRDDAARDLRRRHRPRAHRREQRARRERSTSAGRTSPSFGSRKVTTKLRLREGESNLLAGLLRGRSAQVSDRLPGPDAAAGARARCSDHDQRRSTQTDIVMLLTPHIVRTHELTAEDLSPIYIGTQQNLGLGGPPPLIAPAPDEQVPAPAGAAAGVVPTDDSRNAAARTCRASGGGVRRACRRPTPRRRPARRRCRTFPPPTARRRWCHRRRLRHRLCRRRGSATAAGAAAASGAACRRRSSASTRRWRRREPPRDADATRRRRRPVRRSAHAGAGDHHGPPGTSSAWPGAVHRAGARSTTRRACRSMTLTVTFNPKVLRVRNVQDGTFMRQGGVRPTFTPRIDAAPAAWTSRSRARRSGRRIGRGPARGAAVRRRRAGQLDRSPSAASPARPKGRRWRCSSVR